VKIYFFDFDGTLFKRDSMIEFLLFLESYQLLFYLKNLIFIPIYLLFKTKIISRTSVKEIFLKIHLFNKTKKEIELSSKNFSKYIIKYMYKDALDYLSKIEGEKCIVSASLDIWMNDIARELNCNLISTESIFINKRFNRIDGKNCFGNEKVKKIKKYYNLLEYDTIYVFGDSDGDNEMLNLSDNSYYRFFNK